MSDHPDETAEHPSLRTALEAILMVVDEPVGDVLLAQVTERPTDEVRGALQALATEYDEAGRGFELREVAGGWRFYTRASCAAYVERFVLDGQQARLTQAALETLAVVAYRQPVSRARVSAVRGVNVETSGGANDVALMSVGRDGRTVTVVQWQQLGDFTGAPVAAFKKTTTTAVNELY